MRRVLVGVLLVIASAIMARAQTAAPLVVKIAAANDASEISSQVEAKIGSTTRYALTSSDSWAFLLSITCLSNQIQGTNRILGYTCSETVVYRSPFQIVDNLEAFIQSCPPDGAYCAEKIFENFVKETQPDEMQKEDDLVKGEHDAIFVQGYNKGFADGWAGASKLKPAPCQTTPRKPKAQTGKAKVPKPN